MATLTAEQVAWLRHGDRGISSEALFEHLTGHTLARAYPHDHPRDAGDFCRCLVMLRQCGLEDRIGEAASRSPEWAALVAIWPALTAEMDSLTTAEAQRKHGWSRTLVLASYAAVYQAMRAALEPVEKAREAKKESG